MKPAFAAGAALTLAILPGCLRTSARPTVDGLTPVPAARYIIEAFDHYPLIAFSEPRHGAGGTKEFLASLVRQPGFAGTIQDLVVEFGNARYQDVVDRYMAGEPVARDQLKRAWEETTIATGMWLAPMYEAVLADLRAVNLTRPPDQRVRVLLGDPPIDWSVVRGPADEDMNDWRDAHFAWVVEQQVLEKQHKALIWIGGAHISRQVRFPESLIHLLDRRSPGSTFVVVAVDPTDTEPGVSARLRRWPPLSAVTVRDTWLGQLETASVGMGLSTGTVQENVDAVVVWDPASRAADEAPRIDEAAPIAAELRRRRELAERTLPFRGGRIRFESGTAALTPDSDAPLRIVLAELQRDRGLTLMVKAFNDAREPDGDGLSLARAQAVVDWLTSRGIAPARLDAAGCGSTRALWFGRTEEERAANRRAELVRASPLATCGPPSSFDIAARERARQRGLLDLTVLGLQQ
jgi:outer membrane protein OmpA-like peptidoglycan-associated protein